MASASLGAVHARNAVSMADLRLKWMGGRALIAMLAWVLITAI